MARLLDSSRTPTISTLGTRLEPQPILHCPSPAKDLKAKDKNQKHDPSLLDFC